MRADSGRESSVTRMWEGGGWGRRGKGEGGGGEGG